MASGLLPCAVVGENGMTKWTEKESEEIRKGTHAEKTKEEKKKKDAHHTQEERSGNSV